MKDNIAYRWLYNAPCAEKAVRGCVAVCTRKTWLLRPSPFDDLQSFKNSRLRSPFHLNSIFNAKLFVCKSAIRLSSDKPECTRGNSNNEESVSTATTATIDLPTAR
jgi:hypothetical protein